MMVSLERLQWLLERQLGWIAAADQKLQISVPIATAMLAVTFVSLGPSFVNFSWQELPAIVTTIVLSISLWFSFSALVSRTDGPKDSVIFFGNISSLGSDAYFKKLDKLDENDLRKDLSNQIHRNAQIASVKHASARNSFYCIVIAMPFWLVEFLTS